MPRLDRKLLTFYALMALEEVVGAAQDAPVKRTWGHRLALAYLYSIGVGERCHHNAFWASMGGEDDADDIQSMRDYCRFRDVNCTLDYFYRASGIERTRALMDRGKLGPQRQGRFASDEAKQPGCKHGDGKGDE